MDIEIKVDESAEKTKIIIITQQMNEDIGNLISLLSQNQTHILCGYKDGILKILDPSQIFKIYSENKKVYADTEIGKYLIKMPIYQIVEVLDHRKFVRISSSEIINLDKAAHFDLNHVGTICVKLDSGDTAFVSRRYVSGIKKILGL